MKINYEDLLENSKDFFESSIKSYNDSEYKNAIISLWSGILLLLKCKIYTIHPILLASDILDCLNIKIAFSINMDSLTNIIETRQFSTQEIERIQANLNKIYDSSKELLEALNIENNSKQKVIIKNMSEKRINFSFEIPELEMNYKTVTYDDIKRRLTKFKEKDNVLNRYRTELENLRKVRNRLEHYVNDYDEDSLLTIYNYAIPFINDYLELELHESAEQLFSNWQDFTNIKEMADAREKIVENYIQENQISSRDEAHGSELLATNICSSCGHDTIENDYGELYCKFCGQTEEFHICNTCFESFPVDGWETFHEEMEMCDNCFMEIVNRSK